MDLGSAAGKGSPVESASEVDDPLGAYIQEVEDETRRSEPKPMPSAAPKAAPLPEQKAKDEGAQMSPDRGVRESAPQPRVREAASPDSGPKARPMPLGNRREARDQDSALRPAPRKAPPANPVSEPLGDEQELDGEPVSKSKARRSRRRRAKKRAAAPAGENMQPTRRVEPREEPGMKVVSGTSKKGRLFGWLVSYEDPDGEATELREGKFFVTQESLKRSDLVIDDPSISTPHAMVSVSTDRGVMIQDLMSDAGVHVRERGTEEYKREEEPVQIFHGDWIRFGEVEFLVTLIAHVGEK